MSAGGGAEGSEGSWGAGPAPASSLRGSAPPRASHPLLSLSPSHTTSLHHAFGHSRGDPCAGIRAAGERGTQNTEGRGLT